jgi:hypothetical protein
MSPVIEVRQLHKLRVDEALELYSAFYQNPADWRALIDMLGLAGVVAIDTPADLAEEVETEQRIQFRPSVPLPQNLLESLPDVTNVIYRGDVVVVTGNSNALNAVTSVLARNQIVARQLRVDQAAARFFRWE